MAENKHFNTLIQIGLVVRDLDGALKNFEEIMGIGPFRIAEYPPVDDRDCVRTYHGKKGDFQAKFCFYKFDNIEIELICPIQGENIWTDFLEDHGPGLHHLKFSVPTHQDTEKLFHEHGVEMISSGAAVGPNKGKTWVYYDTWEKLGFFIEMMNEIKE